MSDDKTPKKPLPSFTTDAKAEQFVDEADLSEYDLSGFRPMSEFAFARKKDARLEMRIAQAELDLLKAEAKRLGIPASSLARSIIEQGLKHLTP
jgi:predicted DNA binding CopG/RHH family protein